MTKIEFIAQSPTVEAVWASVVPEDRLDILPKTVVQAMSKKPHASTIEAFIQEGDKVRRFIVAKADVKQTSMRKAREEAGAAIYKKVFEGIEKVLVLDIRHMEDDGLDILTGYLLAGWHFDKYLTMLKPEEKDPTESILILCNHPDEMQQRFERCQAVIEGVLFARGLTSEPPNVLYPAAYAERLKELKAKGVEVEILDEDSLQQIGMTGLLAVGRGSSRQSSVVVMTWNGLKKPSKPIVVVGKGVCFDSGGLCLKPVRSQQEMKWDKAGAGVVAGLIKALALQNAPVNVVGIVGLVENMPDGNAMRPGDVIKTMSGQTVEIADTDAEGRLVLADCLWYAQQRFDPAAIIDLGTLTVETIASLGGELGGLYSTDPNLVQALKAAGKKSGDEVWELPMGPFFAKQIESPIADMKNVGLELCGENGAAAEFLKRFIKNVPWAHIDIAGVSWSKEDLPLARKGVTGYGVRLLEEWLTT